MFSFFIAQFVILILFIILPLSLTILALVDLLKSEFPGPNDKIMWVIIVLFLPYIGVILYFTIGRKNKKE